MGSEINVCGEENPSSFSKIMCIRACETIKKTGRAFCYDTEGRDATALIKASDLQNSTCTFRHTTNKIQRDVCECYSGTVEEFSSSGMQCCVPRLVIPDVSKECTTSIFKDRDVKQEYEESLFSSPSI